VVKVLSQARCAKGNVLEVDGKLVVVMKAENIHPRQRGTPVTHLDMRRIADGVKITERYRTTDQVRNAPTWKTRTYNYLYEDDMGYNFMEARDVSTQLSVPKEILGDAARLPAGKHAGQT